MTSVEKTVAAEVKYNVKVPVENWIDFVVHNVDIYRYQYSGYWLRHVEYDEEFGNLVWEDDEKTHHGQEPNRAEALAMWRTGTGILPHGWFVVNEKTAIQAYIVGCKRWGEDWMNGDHNDSTGYDVVIQLTLLGEVRYG